MNYSGSQILPHPVGLVWQALLDPQVTANIHEIEADGEGGRMALRIEGVADARNPRSSVMTAHSVVRSILNRNATVLM